MRAAILQHPRHFEVVQRPIPEPGPGEIRVRTEVCGMCTGELDQFEGKGNLEYPRFIGHEVSGVIDAVGDRVDNVAVGDRVTIYSDGKGYAEYTVVPATWAVKLAESTPFELALGEPIACSVNGVRKADPQMGDSVAIVGCGFMGLIMLQVFKARGAGTVIAIDRRDSMLELASSMGADHVLNTGSTDVIAEVKALTGGKGVDIGVEAAGIQATLDLTTQLVRMEGKLEVFGFHMGEPRKVDWGYWNWMAFQIVNGHTRNPDIYVEGIRIGVHLMETGRLDMSRLVTHRFSLEEINRGFEMAVGKADGFVKGVVVLGDGR
ncbi:MAG TPA: zinc-binding dehydrogenase [Rhodothermales bacterium]